MTDYYRSIKPFPVQLKVPLSHRNRRYRILQLSNGILTLLISDPSKDVGSAAICVATGSHNDPMNIPGLAHLCEHTLFLDTKEFSKPHAYHEIVLAHGGKVNAFTTGEKTCFHFEIPTGNTTNLDEKCCKKEVFDEPIFDCALRNFASCFKQPIFHQKEVRSEILLVNDEHIFNMNSLEKILLQGLRNLSNKNHPFSRFATGNTDTLEKVPKSSKINLCSELSRFFRTHYVPEKMTLVISGPQSLNNLQRLSLTNFSNIRPKRVKFDEKNVLKDNLSKFTILSDSWNHIYKEAVFTKCNLNKCLFIKNENHSRLRVTFPIEPRIFQKEYKLYKSAWINMLGDESPGSLCSYLVDYENLATSVNLFTLSLTYQDEILILDIDLTAKGRKNIQVIIVSIYQYINQVILNCSYKIMGHYLSEMATIQLLNYIYKDLEKSSMNEVVSLSETLQKDISIMKPENILKGCNDWSDAESNYSGEYKNDPTWWRLMAAKFIVATIKTLNSSNCNIVVLGTTPEIIKSITKSFSNSINHKFRDLYYAFEYNTYDINLTLINNESMKNCSYFTFPKPNAYLANSQKKLFDILETVSKYVSSNSLSVHFIKPSTIAHPNLVNVSQSNEIWSYIDKSMIKIITSCRIQSLALKSSPINTIGIEILSELIGNKLRHELYSGELVGYSWGLFPCVDNSTSITLTISGFPNKFHTFLATVIENLKETVLKLDIIPYSAIMRARVSVRKHYEDILKSQGIEKAIAASTIFLEEGIWSIEQRLEALQRIDSNILKNIAMNLFGNMVYTMILIQGNVQSQAVDKISKTFQTLTKHEKFTTSNISTLELYSYLMQEGRYYIYEDRGPNNDKLSTAFYYLQIGCRENIFDRTITKFIEHIFSIFASIELRTNRQLGYFVCSGFRLFRRTLGVYISISSGTYDPYYLNSQIDDFLYELELMVFNFTDLKFEIELKQKFVESYLNHETQKNGFCPSNEIYAIKPAKSSSIFPNDKLYYMHKNCFEKIVNKTYRFGGFNGEDEIDLNVINELTKNQFLEFFRKKISIKSKTRSSLSLLFPSQAYNDRLKMKPLQNQLLDILRKEGISIDDHDLNRLFHELNDNNNVFDSVSNTIKFKNERKKKSLISTLHIFKGKFDYFKSAESDQKYRHRNIKKINIIKELGQTYSTNTPCLRKTILDNWKQLHINSTLLKTTSELKLLDKLDSKS